MNRFLQYEIDGAHIMLYAAGTNGFIVSAYPLKKDKKNKKLRK